MPIIPQDTTVENSFQLTVDTFFKKLKVDSILKNCNTYKVKGIPCTQVFKLILMLVFTGKNLFMNYESDNPTIPFKKDVVYRMLNSVYINWKKFLYLLSAMVINHHISSLTDNTRADAFIIDDSFFSRTRSKSVELLSQVNDHADGNRSKKGFRMLTLGWTDGNSFIPVSFNLLVHQILMHS